MSSPERRIVVLGVGNLLLRDDGVGVHVVQELQKSPPQIPGTVVELCDGGTTPNLAYLAEGADKVIIVDAMQGGAKPGTIYCFQPEEVMPKSGEMLSLHEWGLENSLAEMARTSPKPVHTVIIGVEPQEIGPGMELSPEVKARIPKIIQVVREQIEVEQNVRTAEP